MPWFKGDASHTSKKTLFGQDTFTIWIKIYNHPIYRINTLQIMKMYTTDKTSKTNASGYRLKTIKYKLTFTIVCTVRYIWIH